MELCTQDMQTSLTEPQEDETNVVIHQFQSSQIWYSKAVTLVLTESTMQTFFTVKKFPSPTSLWLHSAPVLVNIPFPQ